MDKMKKILGLQHGGEEEGDKEGEGGGGAGIKFAADTPSSPPSNKKQKDARNVRMEDPSDGGAKGKGPSRSKAKSSTPQSVSRRDETRAIGLCKRGFHFYTETSRRV